MAINTVRIYQLKRHVRQGDYFGTVATVINNLVCGVIRRGRSKNKFHISAAELVQLNNTVQDLQFLQAEIRRFDF